MATLTAARAKAIRDPGKHRADKGLYLDVRSATSKSWVQRITIFGRRRDIGLGSYPAISLAQARKQAAENRATVAEGRDPTVKEVKVVIPTFREAAYMAHETHLPRWKNPKHTKEWIRTLERHAFPVIGGKPIDSIGVVDVLGVLTPIWSKVPETARRVRQRMRTVFKWAMAHDFIDLNPAGEAIEGALPPMRRIVNGHRKALPYQQVPDAILKIRSSEAWPATKLAFEFLILTACRSGEVRSAMWSEIDVGARLWTIPAERMKARKEHRVPLSASALTLLESAREFRDSTGLVFPSPQGKMLSDNALSLRARKDKLGAVPHGFRSSFRDWAAECTSASHAAMELSLAHSVGSEVERSYARSDLLEQRRELMEAWGDYICSSDPVTGSQSC
ncbi:MAG: DUF4102 domain-containing protein [Dehalococcoidia bacterium]|nr:DUF4102 domain-containing protein [Dehalococcoidia bacterium]